jgi:hypothetical protein
MLFFPLPPALAHVFVTDGRRMRQDSSARMPH